MKNIPFPNPHDADALNNYLDALTSGERPQPENDVQSAARAFHALAGQADVSPGKRRTETMKGQETMHAAALTAPVSNRTRKQQTARKSSRPNVWLSAVIIAGLLISMISYTWMNRDNGNPNENLAFAPGTPSAVAEEVLTPESAPWIADFDPADCTETSGLQQVAIDYQDQQGIEPQGYGVVGPAEPADAEDAVEQYRAMRSCATYMDAWAYWSEARVYEHRRMLNAENQAELTELQVHFAGVYPEQFMAVSGNLAINTEIEAEWTARIEAEQLGLPIPLDAKLNPDWAVELSDGRIAFPATIMYSVNDPAITTHGLPVDTPASTVVMIFTSEDGSWKYDDSLQLCLVNCESGIGNPMTMENPPTASSSFDNQCTLDEMTAGEFRERTATIPNYSDRSYQPVGTPDPIVHETIIENFNQFGTCSANFGEYTMYPIFTDLGMFSWMAQSSPDIATTPELVPFLRDSDRGAASIVAKTPQWHQIDVIGAPVHRGSEAGFTISPMWSGRSENRAFTKFVINYADPERAVLLDDDRVAVTTTVLLSSEDRGAIFYEGDTNIVPMPIVIYKEHEGTWLIDQVIAIKRHTGQSTPSQSWWWDPQYDPEFIWTAPISYRECPEDATPNRLDPENSSGTLYVQDDYDRVSSERNYEIVGPADPEDANAVVMRIRGVYGCVIRNESLPWWSARFEYENRTTAGRESLEAIDDQRTEGAEGLAVWYDDELGLTPPDMYVVQNPDELTLDGSEALTPRTLFNPEHAVLFADGRIGLLPSVVTYDEAFEDFDPESAPYFISYVTILVYQDGQWLLDENLPICIGECDVVPDGMEATPIGLEPEPFATPED